MAAHLDRKWGPDESDGKSGRGGAGGSELRSMFGYSSTTASLASLAAKVSSSSTASKRKGGGDIDYDGDGTGGSSSSSGGGNGTDAGMIGTGPSHTGGQLSALPISSPPWKQGWTTWICRSTPNQYETRRLIRKDEMIAPLGDPMDHAIMTNDCMYSLCNDPGSMRDKSGNSPTYDVFACLNGLRKGTRIMFVGVSLDKAGGPSPLTSSGLFSVQIAGIAIITNNGWTAIRPGDGVYFRIMPWATESGPKVIVHGHTPTKWVPVIYAFNEQEVGVHIHSLQLTARRIAKRTNVTYSPPTPVTATDTFDVYHDAIFEEYRAGFVKLFDTGDIVQPVQIYAYWCAIERAVRTTTILAAAQFDGANYACLTSAIKRVRLVYAMEREFYGQGLEVRSRSILEDVLDPIADSEIWRDITRVGARCADSKATPDAMLALDATMLYEDLLDLCDSHKTFAFAEQFSAVKTQFIGKACTFAQTKQHVDVQLGYTFK